MQLEPQDIETHENEPIKNIPQENQEMYESNPTIVIENPLA